MTVQQQSMGSKNPFFMAVRGVKGAQDPNVEVISKLSDTLILSF